MDRIILHADFDSFFASCEQHFNPNLRGKPIGVTAENGRTCIIAASREAKRFGIKTGTRSWEAKRICPEIVFVPADFGRYLEITKKFISICKDYSPTIEVFSIDELFMDLTNVMHLYPSLHCLAQTIKSRIRKEIGETITLSIGISYNKLLAKLASGMNKPDGFYVLEKKMLPEIYKTAKLTDVCGIGERINRRLNLLGVYNFYDLQNISLQALKKEFGNAWALQLKKFAFFQDTNPVVSYTTACEVKSVGRNYCLPKNEDNQTVILQNVYELCCEVGLKLRKLGKKGKTVGLSLSGDGNNHGEKTINNYINFDKDIFSVCRFLYKKWNCNQMVRQMSVWVSNLSDEKMVNLNLFENLRKEKVIKAVDSINETFGDHTIRNGFLTYADKLTTKPNGYFADRYERDKLSLY